MPAVTVFQLAVSITGALLTCGLALWLFGRGRPERPPVGVFNGRDLVVLGGFIVLLPYILLELPIGVIQSSLLAVTFLSGGIIALRPVASARVRWVVVPLLLTANIAVTAAMSELPAGIQLYWLLNSAVVVLAAAGAGNLYVQGGLTLRHVAWLGVYLAVYDLVFTGLLSTTRELAAALGLRPLDPSFGFRIGDMTGTVGLGDALMYSLFILAARKGYGRRGTVVGLGVVVVAGAVIPCLIPLFAPGLFGGLAGAFVPVQIVFGPAILITHLWLSRTSEERSGKQWFREHMERIGLPGAAVARSRLTFAFPGAAVTALVLAVALWTGRPAASTEVAEASQRMPAEPTAGRLEVTMKSLRFTPERMVVRVGQTVTWRNADAGPHDVVATSGATFRSAIFDQGGTYEYRATAPGETRYVCSLHPGMDGTIVVTE